MGGEPHQAAHRRRHCRGAVHEAGFFEYLPAFKLVIAGNHKPSLRSVDEAIRRRFRLIPFAVTIPTDERDCVHAVKLAQLDALVACRRHPHEWAMDPEKFAPPCLRR